MLRADEYPIQTLVVSRETRHKRRATAGTVVVSTPLDMISRLESSAQTIATVVLAGSFATDANLGAFLIEFYPFLEVIDDTDEEEFRCGLTQIELS